MTICFAAHHDYQVRAIAERDGDEHQRDGDEHQQAAKAELIRRGLEASPEAQRIAQAQRSRYNQFWRS